jgi:hypothetical protein
MQSGPCEMRIELLMSSVIICKKGPLFCHGYCTKYHLSTLRRKLLRNFLLCYIRITAQMRTIYVTAPTAGAAPENQLTAHNIKAEAGHILYLRILYPIHIQAPKKDIISYHYHVKKKDMDIYPISFVKNFASVVTVSEQQKARPGKTAAHKSSTFYWLKLKP